MQIEKPSLSSEQKSLAQEFSSMRSPHQDKGERAATDLDTLNLPNNETRELAQNQAQNLEINSAVNKPIVKEQNYIENFINNKMVSQVFPNIMNWLNIGGNIFSFLTNAFDVNDSIKKVASKLASFATKSIASRSPSCAPISINNSLMPPETCLIEPTDFLIVLKLFLMSGQ